MEKKIIIDNYSIIEYEKTSIYVIENVLDDDFCNKVVNIIETIPLRRTVYTDTNNVECYFSLMDQLLKTSDKLFYKFSTQENEVNDIIEKIKSKQSIYTNKMNGITKSEIKYVNEKITEAMNVMQQIMSSVNKKIQFDNTGYTLRKIYGPTRCHCDGVSETYEKNVNFIKNNHVGDYKMIRNTSIIFALNDDHEGGIVNFPYHNVSMKLKKGSVLIFPPYWTHPHEVSELKNNTFRYTINTWSVQKI
jgi:hypothetical protein